jgi:hypothetical protein
MNDVDLAVKFAREMPYKIAREVGFKDVREYPHNEWMREIITGKADYTLLAHRGSYKSSVLSVCIALIMVLMPYQNIIFLRKADNDVAEMIRMVKKALDSEVIQSLALILYKKRIILTESTTSSITTNLFMSASGASQLLGIGLKSSITGKHGDLVITDDICNITDRISKAERDRTKLQYQELGNIRNRGGRIINLGTKWHTDDVFTLMDNIHSYDCYTTKIMTQAQIDDLKDRMTPSLFSCNYELRIIPSDDVLFTDPKTGAPREMAMQGESHVDAAYYGEDWTAYTTIAIHDRKFYVLGKCWRKHIEDVEDQIVAIQNEMKAGRLHMETNADKGYAAKSLKQKGVRVATYHESQNKYIKISSYLKAEWADVIFVEGTDPKYIEMICDYNEDAEHDDCPDSLASLIRIIGRRKNRTTETRTVEDAFSRYTY